MSHHCDRECADPGACCKEGMCLRKYKEVNQPSTVSTDALEKPLYEVEGPYYITQGRQARIACLFCGKPVALRNGPPGHIFLLNCERIECVLTRITR